MPIWKFIDSNPNNVENEPVHEEFFAQAESASDLTSLVRESIQNSLDARLSPSLPVEVRFNIGVASAEQVRGFFKGLSEHIAASNQEKSLLEDMSKDCHFLVVEDFNTTGLRGKVDATHEEAQQNPTENGYRFFRFQIGDTSKRDGKRGTWGIGKVVFPRLSQIKTYFVHSIRDIPSEDESIYFGQSMLRYHTIDGTRYTPHGWWGDLNQSQIQVPFSSNPISFDDVWQISRTDETGLSVVVPFVLEENANSQLVKRAVLQDFYIPVLKGDLEVKIFDDSTQVYQINSTNILDSIREWAEDSKEQKILSLLQNAELFSSYLANTTDNFQTFEIDLRNGKKWSDIRGEKELVRSIQDAFFSGTLIEFDIKVSVPMKRDSDRKEQSSFIVLLTRDLGAKVQAVFCRQGIIISRANPEWMNDTSAVVLIDEVALANFLSSSENPSHDNWSPNSEKQKARYKPKYESEKLISLVKRSTSEILKLINRSEDEIDNRALANFFPKFGDRQPGVPSSGIKDPNSPKPNVPDLPSENGIIRFERVGDGFVIRPTEKTKKNSRVVVRMGYALRRGKAIPSWTPEDFLLEHKYLDSKSKDTDNDVILSGNRLSFNTHENDFELIFGGFDQWRDLEFKAGYEL